MPLFYNEIIFQFPHYKKDQLLFVSTIVPSTYSPHSPYTTLVLEVLAI